MLNPALYTFMEVADSGSFTKAAGKLYVSPTAVMKQIDTLEKHLGLTLFERTAKGVKLTPPGESLYKDTAFLLDYTQKAVASARAASEEAEKTFCVGTSVLNPAKPFMDLWYGVSHEFIDYKLHLVPFEDKHEDILSEIEQLGIKFDFLVGVCDSASWLDKCRMLTLGRYKKMIAVRRGHVLTSKKSLKITDLYGHTLMMVAEGDSAVNDRLRHDLQKNHPQINIEDTPRFYDMEVFNRCAATDNALLTIECWQDVHPALVTLPVEWDYTIPYGLLYSKNPPGDVERFVETVRATLLCVGLRRA